MKNKKKILLSSVMVIALCLSLIAGSTFALFTSESKVNVAVTSGKVEVVASLSTPTIYSAKASEDIATDSEAYAGTATAFGVTSKYEWEKQTETTYDDEHKVTYYVFKNTGTASIVGDTITLNRITPGDKVTFDVNVANNSNVNIQYRVLINVTKGLKLFNKLKVIVDDVTLGGVSKTGSWQNWTADNQTREIDIPVVIYLPVELDGEEFMNEETRITVTVEAVQGNAKTENKILTSEITATEDVTVDSSNNKVAAQTEITDNAGLVKIKIPEETQLTDNDTSLTVKVTPQDTVSNITVLATQGSASYDVSVLFVDQTSGATKKAVADENNSAIEVRMFIGTGLLGVRLYHKDQEIDYTEYDSESGYITFLTSSFSEYTVVYNVDYAYETEENGQSVIKYYKATKETNVYIDEESNETVVFSQNDQGEVYKVETGYLVVSEGVAKNYDSFEKAFADLKDGDLMRLVSDDEIDFEKSYIIKDKTVTFDLNGFELKVTHNIDVNGDESEGTACFELEHSTLNLQNGEFTFVHKNECYWAPGAAINVFASTLNLDGVTIDISGTDDLWTAIYAVGEDLGNKSYININKGTVIDLANDEEATITSAIVVDSYSELNMNDGEININSKGNEGNNVFGIWLTNAQSGRTISAVANIKGGKINVNGTAFAAGVLINNSDATVNMTAGEISVKTSDGEAMAFGTDIDGTINLLGGTVNVEATGGNAYAIEFHYNGKVTLSKAMEINVTEDEYNGLKTSNVTITEIE